jgi:glycosyltransferase involved in cell wall biosynthesis
MNTPSTSDLFISVVIASVNGPPAIHECLQALTQQEGDVSYEVLVVDRCSAEVRTEIQRRFPQPQIRLIAVEGFPSIPKLRAIGIAAANGQLIAILEDHCNVPPRWFDAIARAHHAGYLAIGSPVENGSVERLIDWAVFFCEYARFMPPMPRGVVSEIPGNCAVYDRQLLNQLGTDLRDEVWDSFLHQRMRELGVSFYCEPEMTVSHKKEFGFGYFMSQRYHYSRSFSGMRMRGAPLWKRIAFAAATAFLPPLLFARMGKTIWEKGRRQTTFLLATPVISAFLLSWAWGEAIGALLGPGKSLARVE